MAKDVDLIKQKLDLVDIIKSYVNLSPAGKNFKGLCPFHSETKPSFMVSPERGLWHCFGCSTGGDLIKFVMMYENMEFPEALRFLAERAGIEIESVSRRDQKEFDNIYSINEAAKKFFVGELKKNKQIFDYLLSRGLKNETIEEFELGFSPGGDTLITHLLGSGFDLPVIVKAGLGLKSDRGLYKDRFFRRIMFPIANEIQKVVAFTGRIYDPEGRLTDAPKYLNSPETLVFNKSKILYGLNKSKTNIVKSRIVFLVEGQMDFLMLWGAGIKNAVAISGTGLTNYHLNKLRRLAETIVVSFDNDDGGLRALERALDIFSNFDFHIKAVNLGKFSDPAEAVLADVKFFKKAVEEAKPAFNHLFDHYFNDEKPTSVIDRKKVVRHLLGIIGNVKSKVEQDMWVKELARYSGISEPALMIELEYTDRKDKKDEGGNKLTQESTFPAERIDVIAKRLLLFAFAKEDFLAEVRKNGEFLPQPFRDIINNREDEKLALLELQSNHEIGNLDDGLAEKEFNELLRQLRIEFLKKRQTDLRGKIKLAEDRESNDLPDLIGAFHGLAKEIDELKK